MGVGILYLVVGVALLVAIPAAWVMIRRQWLISSSGTFPCLLHTASSSGHAAHWVPGFGWIRGQDVWWYPAIGFNLAPQLRFPRARTDALPMRDIDSAEVEHTLGSAALLLPLRRQIGGGQAVWNMALTPASAMALQSWLEAAAPGMGRRPRPLLRADESGGTGLSAA